MDEFLIIRNFVDLNQCNTMVAKLDDWHANGFVLPPDDLCPISDSFYGIFNDESTVFLPKIEELVGKKLFPTYTYARIYARNEMLLPHRDRGACEYSFSLTLKYDQEVWPLYLQTDAGIEEVFLEPGDMLLYRGTEQLHWRLRLNTAYQYQAVFHDVDQNGPYADIKFDGRVSFGSTQDALDVLKRKKHVL